MTVILYMAKGLPVQQLGTDGRWMPSVNLTRQGDLFRLDEHGTFRLRIENDSKEKNL